MSGYHHDAADPRPWYIIKMEAETDAQLREFKGEVRGALDDVRKEIRALRWTLAAVAALAALAGNVAGSLPT